MATTIKNDPMSYKKRTDIAKAAGSDAVKRSPCPLTREQHALVMDSFKTSRRGKPGYLPLGRILAK